MKYWAGIDLGGTNIVCGLVDEDLNLLGKLKQPTEAAKGSGFVLERMAAMVKQLLEETGIPLNELQGVGIGCPGFINPEDGVCMFAGNLGWRDLPVAHLLSAKLQVPVFIDNDVRMYVFGEERQGQPEGISMSWALHWGPGWLLPWSIQDIYIMVAVTWRVNWDISIWKANTGRADAECQAAWKRLLPLQVLSSRCRRLSVLEQRVFCRSG